MIYERCWSSGPVGGADCRVPYSNQESEAADVDLIAQSQPAADQSGANLLQHAHFPTDVRLAIGVMQLEQLCGATFSRPMARVKG